GEVYWGKGRAVATETRTWKWSGSNFIALSGSQTDSLHNKLKQFDESTRLEGWNISTPDRGEMSCRLNGEAVNIVDKDELGSQRERVYLIYPENKTNSDILIDVKLGYQKISK